MSTETARPPEADDRIEVGLHIMIFALHPEHLTAAELLGRMETSDPGMGDEPQAVERALRSLQRSELVHEADGVIVPTRAALHFDALPF